MTALLAACSMPRGIVVAGIRRHVWVVFAVFCVLVFLFGAFPGSWFEEGVDREEALLLSSFAAGMAVFGMAMTLTAFRRGARWAWLAFWFWPVFLIVHGIAFFFVDFIFAAVAVAALVLARPATSRPAPS